MTKLSVNLNAVAMLRNRRDVGWPSVTGIARVVLDAGAAGITVHPRPDERHIRRADVFELPWVLKDYPAAEFNIEGYPSPEFLTLVAQVKPQQVTFVPDLPGQATSDHGWDVYGNEQLLRLSIGQVQGFGARAALFIDADLKCRRRRHGLGLTGLSYTPALTGRTSSWQKARGYWPIWRRRRARAHEAGVEVNAGHDLTLENLPEFMAAVKGVDEVSIGHGITADALLLGFAEAVRQYSAALSA